MRLETLTFKWNCTDNSYHAVKDDGNWVAVLWAPRLHRWVVTSSDQSLENDGFDDCDAALKWADEQFELMQLEELEDA